MSKPVIRKGPASNFAEYGEAIYEFTDGQSGGLIAIERDDADRLIVDLYRMDPDVLVRTPGGGEHDWIEAPDPDEPKPEQFVVNVPRTYRAGWGVAVNEVWSGDDDPTEHIEAIDVEVVRIDADAARIIGGVPCVQTADEVEQYAIWHPIENFRDLPDLTGDDSHDLRDRWFATEQEAREHAARVRREWDNPLPWQPFAVTS
jgi:hypothetical protein